MRIHFRSQADCDFFSICDQDDFHVSFVAPMNDAPMKILLPENLEPQNFLLLIQASLDQIKPVVLLRNLDILDTKKILELKSTHFKLEEGNFLFLNYSIRNSLSRFDSSLLALKSFAEITEYFEQNLLRLK